MTLLDVLSRRFNITDTAFSWFQSYLSGRTQTVVYNEQQTGIIEIDCSVPQGSVFGPVKFAAYTEDSVDVVDRHQTRLHLYTLMIFSPMFFFSVIGAVEI